MIYLIGIFIVIIFLMFGFFFLKYNKLKDINNSLDIVKDNINILLTEKLKLVEVLLNDIKNDSIKEKFSYNNDLSIYERENTLFLVSFDINKFVKDENIKNKKILQKIKDLNSLEENLDGLKDFYNANVLNYNEIFLKRFLNKIFRRLKFEDYKSFKIRKLEEYEIFKN